jgi:hypothetical protein
MNHSGKPLTSWSPAIQAQIAAQLHGTKPPVPAPADKPRLRQSGKGPNKTEQAFMAHMQACHPGRQLFEQAVTLVLANGLRYTPDVFLPDAAVRPQFYEVKGHMRDDAAAKLKMAARVHAWATFFLVTKRPKHRGGGWDIQEILR